jgi:hypothetical protein
MRVYNISPFLIAFLFSQICQIIIVKEVASSSDAFAK